MINEHIPICQYCGNLSELVTGEVVYPGLWHLRDKQIYRCAPCSAWVGCHDGTTKPLGRLANATLRKAKTRAHAAFDPLWRKKFGWTETKFPNRGAAYKWLAEQLGMTRDECHIGMFDVEMCKRVEAECFSFSKSASPPSGSLPSGESDPSVTLGCGGADT